MILAFFKGLCHNSELEVDKEIMMSLLKTLIGLFIRIRSHSYAKTVKEKYIAKNKTLKARPLRTEIEKTVNLVDNQSGSDKISTT